MKLRNLFWGAIASLAAFAACEEPEQNLGTPDISISATEMTFDQAGGEKELAVKATRDWKVETDADWVVVSPESGTGSAEAYKVTVTTLENTGLDREASLKFTIGMKSKYLTVTQEGPGGSAEALIVYYNDFDKEEATKTYGSSGGSWPYLDQFEGWKNATGTGAANVSYSFKGMSARANSTSDSNYSDYAGSGKNNMFFGASAYFSTNNIALGGAKDFTLTFGTEKYSQDNGSVFTNSEYKIFLSRDGAKWVELTDYTFAGGAVEGRWNIASANFSVPEGTENLSICMQVTVASSYRMDDMKLVISEGGAAVDFSKAVEMDFEAGNPGGSQGGGASDASAIYSNNYDKSAASQGSNGWPFLDNSDDWKNAAGTGAANVTYNSKNVTVRNNSNSNGSYSDYEGSGLNNIFFGKDYPYFSTNNIALGGVTDLTLTFGTEKYSQEFGSDFTNSEYHIWLSADGEKWVELTDYTFAGTASGRWNVATANFSVPAGTANLSICMQVDVASSYRLDDFKLVASATAGTAIDFTQAVEKDFSAGGTTGGDNPGGGDTPVEGQPANLVKVTIAEFIAAAEDDTWYELTGEITSIEKQDWGNFWIKDATGEILIYGMTSKWVGSNDKSFSQIGLKVGDTVTLGSLRTSYNETPQGGGNKIPAFYISHIAGEGGSQGGEEPVTPPASDGQYDSELTWTLGANAYDVTSQTPQKAIVNGVMVENLLKLGKSSAGGDATVSIPSGTAKIGFYAVGWNKSNGTVLTCEAGNAVENITLAANTGAAGNPDPTYEITVTDSDYYTVAIPSGVESVVLKTTGKENCRAIIFGLKAVE